ncbi:hypothetical protein SALBM217S_01045 [Streptomyces griseoloalbus]
MSPVSCIAPYTTQATPPFSVTISTVARSCWSSTANASDSPRDAAICSTGCGSDPPSAASGTRLAPSCTPKYSTVSTPITMPTKKYSTSSRRADAVM